MIQTTRLSTSANRSVKVNAISHPNDEFRSCQENVCMNDYPPRWRTEVESCINIGGWYLGADVVRTEEGSSVNGVHEGGVG